MGHFSLMQAEAQSTVIFTIESTDAGKRLDAFLAEKIEGWSRARLQRLIDDGDVLVNGRKSRPSYKLRGDDEIGVELTEIPAARFEPENIPLDIVYEDEVLAVINKPAGMVVHPGAGATGGTLANAIAYHFSPQRRGDTEENKTRRPNKSEPPASAGGRDAADSNRVGIMHRLDKDTSGLIVVAKDEETHDALATQFRNRDVFKSYVALVHGSPRENSGRIDRPIARDRWHRTKMTVAANGRNALSLWKVRKRFGKFTLLDVEIKTGRTHQIRVHLAAINHPVVGDETYNEGRDKTVADPEIRQAIQKVNRHFLHAEKLSFTHPRTGTHFSFTAELPGELKELLKLL